MGFKRGLMIILSILTQNSFGSDKKQSETTKSETIKSAPSSPASIRYSREKLLAIQKFMAEHPEIYKEEDKKVESNLKKQWLLTLHPKNKKGIPLYLKPPKKTLTIIKNYD